MRTFTRCSCLFLAAALCGCISRDEPTPVRFFEPELPPLTAPEVPGTRPLRFGPVSASAHLRSQMVWRISGTEVATDDVHLWVEEPAKILDRRLRDLLYGGEGYRESLRSADPELRVHLAAFEGDVDGNARVEVVLELSTGSGVGHRTRLVEVETLRSVDAEGLALAMGSALGRVADGCVVWVEERLAR